MINKKTETMSAEYDLIRRPNAKGDGELQPLYPRIVSKGTIKTKRLVREISEASSFTEGDLEGVLVALTEKISNYLIEGYHVELGKIGYFSSKLKARPVMDKKEIRSNSIYFDNINFRASMWFRRHSRGYVERATYGFRQSSNLPESTRRARMEKFLSEHPFMTREDYSSLTGLLKGKALRELRIWVEQGVLATMGRGSHKVYIKPVKQVVTTE